MTKAEGFRGAAGDLLDRDEIDGVLSGAFYAASPVAPDKPLPTQKPEHYKVICISLYKEDLGRLDKMVETLKAKGLTKANRSALIRYALQNVDLDRVPRGLG